MGEKKSCGLLVCLMVLSAVTNAFQLPQVKLLAKTRLCGGPLEWAQEVSPEKQCRSHRVRMWVELKDRVLAVDWLKVGWCSLVKPRSESALCLATTTPNTRRSGCRHEEVLSILVWAYKIVALGIWGLLAAMAGLSPSDLSPAGRENGFVLQLWNTQLYY